MSYDKLILWLQFVTLQNRVRCVPHLHSSNFYMHGFQYSRIRVHTQKEWYSKAMQSMILKRNNTHNAIDELLWGNKSSKKFIDCAPFEYSSGRSDSSSHFFSVFFSYFNLKNLNLWRLPLRLVWDIPRLLILSPSSSYKKCDSKL